jgi:excisionase family DNA binding protein
MTVKKDSTDDDSERRPTGSGGDDELMTTKQVMVYLQLSRTKIWELVNKENLPAFKIGGDYRYRRSEIDAWMEGYRVRKEQT